MPIFIVLGVILFSPTFRAFAGAESFVAEFRPWLAITFLYVGASLAFKTVRFAWRWFLATKVILGLSTSETVILSKFKDEPLVWLSTGDKAVASLLEKDVLVVATDASEYMRTLDQATLYLLRRNPLFGAIKSKQK